MNNIIDERQYELDESHDFQEGSSIHNNMNLNAVPINSEILDQDQIELEIGQDLKDLGFTRLPTFIGTIEWFVRKLEKNENLEIKFKLKLFYEDICLTHIQVFAKNRYFM